MTTTYQKQREEFIARMIADYPATATVDNLRLILRHAKTHGNLAVAECDGPGDYVNHIPYPRAGEIYAEHAAWVEKRQTQIERRIKALCDEIGVAVTFGGDPRGYTVKVQLPSGRYNTWGGSEDGWGVPQ